ncbi:MAG: hypothetical protein WC289_00005 [Patescibacteria group bacterium]
MSETMERMETNEPKAPQGQIVHMRNTKKLVVIIGMVLIFCALVFFFPKKSGTGGTCADCQITSCQCLGIERDYHYVGPVKMTCYGIPHSCQTQNTLTP